MLKRRRFTLSTTHIIALSFLVTILFGALLLILPISSADGKSIPFVDALFTATTSTCVTGLVTLPTFSTFSTFGHIVILLLIQIGGLGVITIITGIMIALHKKLDLRDRILLQDAFNLNTLSGLVRFVKKVILGTLIVEVVGALLYMTVFVPQFGLKGIWISFFTSVSAFCNAGIDIISADSMCNYVHNPIINIVTMLLIIVSGIGYIVWWDILRVLRNFKTHKFKCLKLLTLHSKIAITATVVLIFSGAILVFLFEYNNPDTMKDYSLYQKIQASLFQSVTTRTAGFATIPQQNLSNGSAFISVFLMFIGGSPVGTAGGVKTVTIAVIIAYTIASIKGKNDVSLFNRNISKAALSKAVAVVVTSFSILFISTVCLSAVTDASALDVLYETASATATVGLTRNITPFLDTAGKLIIIATMYFGRIGPISLAFALNVTKRKNNIIKNPTEDISVG